MSNAMNRLLWWHWLLIGLGASLIVFLALYFMMVRPKMTDAATARTDAESIEGSGGTPDKVAAKQRELVNKKKETVRINQEWQVESAVYMPPIDFPKDPLPAYESLGSTGVYHVNGQTYGVKDLPAVWGRWITFWYASQWREGIVPVTGFPIEAFSSDPNDVSSLKAIAFPRTKPWEVEVVAKNFDAAMNHLRKFNRIQRHGMPVVDRVSLSGQSPSLLLRYTLQLFVIPPTAPPPPDPKISGGSSTGGGGGGPMGMGGMGGPMGMGGSSGMMGGGSGMAGPPGGGGKGKLGGT